MEAKIMNISGSNAKPGKIKYNIYNDNNNFILTSSSHWEVSAAFKGVFWIQIWPWEFQQKYNLFYWKNDMVTCMFFEYNVNK